MALLFGLSTFLARNLGPSGYGEYTLTITITTLLLTLVQGGMHTLIVREASVYLTTKSWSQFGGLTLISITFGLLGSTLTIALTLITTYAIFSAPSNAPQLVSIAVWAVPFLIVSITRSAILRGVKKVSLGELSEQVVRPTIMLGALTGWVYFADHLSPQKAVELFLVSAILSAFASEWLYRDNTRKIIPLTANKTFELSRWASSYLRLSKYNWLNIANLHTGIIVLGFMSTKDQIGKFQIAFQVAVLASFFLSIINSIIAPHIAQLHQQSRKVALQTLLNRSAQFASLFSFCALIFIAFAGEALLSTIFGSEYTPAVLPLIIIATGHLASAVCGSAGITLHMLGGESATLKSIITAVILNIVASVVLVPVFNATGAAIAFASSIFALNALNYLALKRLTGFDSSLLPLNDRKILQ